MSFKGLFFFLTLVAAAYGVCELPKAVGPCRARLKRWFHSDGACELFHYSGCGGNENNFATKDSCEQTCLNKNDAAEKPVCESPMDEGPCRGYFEKWFFSEGTCKIFGYSGCGGNENNFDTQDICEQTCLTKGDGTENQDTQNYRSDNEE